jgi:TnpA family transposase
MKRNWTIDELIDHWTLTPGERELAKRAIGVNNQLGRALLLKWFQYAGRFPQRKQEIPSAVVQFLARQLEVSPDVFHEFPWKGRSIERQRAKIRQYLGVREATVEDAEELTKWLVGVVGEQRQEETLKTAVYQRCRERQIEPPTPGRIERIIHSAIRTADQQIYQDTLAQLSSQVQEKLAALLNPPTAGQGKETADAETSGYSVLQELKQAAGAIKLETMLREIQKLKTIEAIGLPDTLFANVSTKVVASYRQRVTVENLHEIKRHPPEIKYTLLAAFCWQRRQELLDTLVELLLDLIHRLGVRAEHKVEKSVLQEIKRVAGKQRILYKVAGASVENPDGVVKEVVYPVVDREILQDLVAEFEATGSYDYQVKSKMRRSYGNHYRQMLPPLLAALSFHSNNEAYRPLIQAIELLKTYAGYKMVNYPETEKVPLAGVVPPSWHDLVVHETKRGKIHINCISYELCVLRGLREKLRCKEIWVAGANRYRNPDEDLPQDFAAKRPQYYELLGLTEDVETFITREKGALTQALAMFNNGLPTNSAVTLTKRHGKSWIRLTPLKPLVEPANLLRLKGEVKERWAWTSLLDILKETDLRVDFTSLLKSATVRENLPRDVLQKRLLLCLYGLGTNTGFNRIIAGDPMENERDLLYVRRRFLNRDNLRAAIRQVVNAIIQVRQPEWWGSETTACASDAKKFGAWDQNLLTEWHIRYRGPGIVVYWHVEKNATCIYSQLKRCSSSEVAAMIEGVLRHCTEMTVEKNYVDSHGQSEVAFAFCHLLGFQLMPRLKRIGSQKLYRADNEDSYEHLASILTRAINWELIRRQYDEMVKFAAALKLGTAEAEAILRRFTRNGPQHPTYQALLELGKVRKTIFLCHFLHDEAIRREIQAGLNVIENWNGVNDFIFYGKSGELETNNPVEQELAVLSLHLLQICLVYINTLMLQNVLADPLWSSQMKEEERRGLTPLFYRHVNPYGEFKLDLDKRLPL